MQPMTVSQLFWIRITVLMCVIPCSALQVALTLYALAARWEILLSKGNCCCLCLKIWCLENKLKSISMHLAYTVTMFAYHKIGPQEIKTQTLLVDIKQCQRNLAVIWATYFYYYSGFPKETPELKFRLSVFFSFSHSLQVLNTHAQRFSNGGQRKVYAVEDQHKYCV